MALRNSDSSHNYTSASDSMVSNKEQRSALYDRMARDLDQHGPLFLKHGRTSQSLSLSDIFTIKDGSVAPILKALELWLIGLYVFSVGSKSPVRANVLHLSTQYSVLITEALKPVLDPYFDKDYIIIAQIRISSSIVNSIEAEAAAVRAVTQELCPLKIVLDRVVLTSTGVLLGCWQVISGSDPITIRAKLRTALPRAPEKQLYDAAILHTSFARLLGHPKASSTMLSNNGDQVHFFHGLVDRLNNELRGFEAVVSELWYVEEFDVLALALNGRMKMRRFQLGSSRN
ncbi:uncharacterized protein Pyn_09341 [Prunus yedoensis var. nudiflora]|uniref:Uncharacterized protein n=1 Tax=Prunus yedoensis var. nudiflora TaxID=2094558 RepID=A0A314V337_PRUYE|nr:uncharacterized protein Pyn_09341 [Prunus yedoensis var. nudiflora]